MAGLEPSEYALLSLLIGGATHLAGGEALPEDLRREGRWEGMAGYRPYVRSHRRDAERVSSVLAECVHEALQQPGQGTKWGTVAPTVRGESREVS